MNVLGIFSLPDWLVVVLILITAAYLYFTWNFGYWEKQNVVTGSYIPFFGSMWASLFHMVHEIDDRNFRKLGKIWGIYELRYPALMVADLDLIKTITVKDFQYFPERRRFPLGSKQRITRLFLSTMAGEEWKIHRAILSPTFTSGKLRQMGNLMSECGDQMIKNIHEAIKTEKDDMDLKMKFGGYSMDVIATCCFGYKINSQDASDPFIVHAKMLFNRSFPILGLVMILMPKVIELLDISFFPNVCLNFFEKVVHQVVGMRKQENWVRNDFLQLLLDAQIQESKGKLPIEKNSDANDGEDQEQAETKTQYTETMKSKRALTEDAVVAHSMLFLLAGFDTTANTISLVLYCLALNPECQDKLIQEVDEALEKHGKLTHDVIMGMRYVDMVLSESLRYFPPGVRLERRCSADYKLGNIQLKEGMMVSVPVYSIHHSEEYYPNPEKFDPERFTPENKASRNPVTYMPFGAGPRNCIGMRFALMEAKIAIAKFFTEFRVSPSSRTQIPMKFRRGIPFLLPTDGIHLKVEKRHS